MKAIKLGFAMLSLVVASGVALASPKEETAARLNTLKGQAGEPVASIRISDRNASWEALGNRDLLVHSQEGNQTWLLHTSLCPGLSSVKNLRLTYAHDARVYVGADKVVRMDEAGGRCEILEARPVADTTVEGLRGTLFTGPRPQHESDLPPKAP